MNGDAMMATLGATFLVIGFLLLFKLLKLMETARQTLSLSRLSLFEISRRDIDDDEKEKNLRAHSLSLVKAIILLLGGSIIAAGLPLLIVWALDTAGMLSLQQTLQVAASWPFLLAASVVTALVFWYVIRRSTGQKTPAAGFENRYSGSARLLHNLAFASTPAQLVLADLEDRLYLKHTQAEAADSPVFITALPRAGTTLLLELCYQTGEFATHSYRDMPFVFTPLLWQRLTRSMQTTGEMRERAHGDGMLVNEDSPEAFEEMLWMAHWERPYRKQQIQLWPQSDPLDFSPFFRNHIRKMVYLAARRRPETVPPGRYLSKNNLNIARIDWLLRYFPGAKIIVPFRDPLLHAASLLRQHQRFSAIHADDAFARHYMAGIGHFDFGANLRPVNFDNWLADPALPAPTELSFWLHYWIAAYQHLLKKRQPNLILLDYDWLCRAPQQSLAPLAAFLQLHHPEQLIAQAGRLEVKPASVPAQDSIMPDLLKTANALHQQLQASSLATFHTDDRLS